MSWNDEVLIRISASHATFGLICGVRREQSGLRLIVTEAPPIARWTIGRYVSDVWHWYERRGAHIQVIQDRERD